MRSIVKKNAEYALETKKSEGNGSNHLASFAKLS